MTLSALKIRSEAYDSLLTLNFSLLQLLPICSMHFLPDLTDLAIVFTRFCAHSNNFPNNL